RELVLNVLADDQEELATRFARSGTPKFQGVAWCPSPFNKAPILVGAVAAIHANVSQVHEAGEHWIVVCEVGQLVDDTGREPLVLVRSGFSGLRNVIPRAFIDEQKRPTRAQV